MTFCCRGCLKAVCLMCIMDPRRLIALNANFLQVRWARVLWSATTTALSSSPCWWGHTCLFYCQKFSAFAVGKEEDDTFPIYHFSLSSQLRHEASPALGPCLSPIPETGSYRSHRNGSSNILRGFELGGKWKKKTLLSAAEVGYR